MARTAGRVALLVASLIGVTAICEGALAVALRFPTLWSRSHRAPRLLRNLHRLTEWRMVQFEPACSRYDAQLTYILRPGGCVVRAREFVVHYRMNGVGLRDDEASLDRPSIIVLGDSVAMGWGVERVDSFPERLETLTGLKVLNAGVPSYGTARELLLLERLDTRALRVLVVQYSWNDGDENRAYVARGGHLPVSPRHDYERTREQYLRGLSYYPGKYVLTLLSLAAAPRAAHAEQEAAEAARLFLDVLLLHRATLRDAAVVVVPAGRHRTAFVRAVRRSLRGEYQESLASVVSITEPTRRLEDEFPLDGHPNSSGHAAYTAAIYAEMDRRGLL
jgi:hypothetical protein